MIISMDMNIPPHFFDSAHSRNNFESVSERIAKAFISQILNEKDVTKGNPDIFEPDYISDFNSYEVTFAVASSIIPQIKGVRPLEKKPFDIQESLCFDILAASKRKSEKRYSMAPTLFIITLTPLLEWYYPFYIKTDLFGEIAWKAMSQKRNDLFDELYSSYIKTGIFKNVLIVQPTHDEHFVLFDIKVFGSYEDADFITKIGVTSKKAFPLCKVTHVDKEGLPMIYNTTIIRYGEEKID